MKYIEFADDRFGDYVLQYFQNEGIDISHIRKCEHGEKSA